MKFEEFILAHDGDDLASLALARGRYAPDVQDFDLALTTLEVRRKLRDKVPEWYDVPALTYPFRLSSEQCSSTATALYKAHVAMAEGTPSAIADLTGGLGVDSWAFSKVFGRVLYNEMRPELAKAAEQKTEAEAARKTVVVNSGTPSTTVVVPTGTKVVVKGNTKNKRSVDEYNRRYTGDATVSNKAAVISGETNYDEELDGEWVGGYEGNADDYEYATRIIRFRNPRFAISISSPYYWDVEIGRAHV